MNAKSNEIPAFTPLLDAVHKVVGSLEGMFVADALHNQAGHARQVATRRARLMTAVKGNQPSLLTRLESLPWTEIPIGERTRDRGHGRHETRTVKAATPHTPGGIPFPHAKQAIRITRSRATNAKSSRETVYFTVTPPAGDASWTRVSVSRAW